MKKKWVNRLLDTVLAHWKWHGQCHHLATLVRQPRFRGESWEIAVAPALQEIADAGPLDGEQVWTPFTFDISEFIKAPGVQQRYLAVRSEGPGRPDPELFLELFYFDKPVNLRLLLRPPEDADVIEVIDLKAQVIRRSNSQEAE
jgi:hypothetical protein